MDESLFAPLSSLQWVERERLHANDYNPNKVSEDNLQLLTQSILTNGWTLPIVVRPDYTIIDGFHRWTVSGREPLKTKLGGKVENANFPENTSDFNSYITNAVNAGAEVIFAPTSTSYAQLIVEQAAAKGVSATIMAGDTWDSNQILSAAKGKKIDIQVTTFYQEGGNADFDKGFKAFLEGNEQNLTDNGGDSNIAAVSAMGYDAYFTALEALKNAGSTDRAKVMEALWKTTYTGVTGAIAFDDVNGDAIRTTAYIKKVNTTTGLWDFVKEQGVAK